MAERIYPNLQILDNDSMFRATVQALRVADSYPVFIPFDLVEDASHRIVQGNPEPFDGYDFWLSFTRNVDSTRRSVRTDGESGTTYQSKPVV